MPAIRVHKPLRERCNIQLRVKTAIPHDDYDDYDFLSDSPAPRRGRTTGRRPIAKQTSESVSHQKPRSKSTEESVPQLHPIHTPTTEGLLGLYRLIPYTYVGFYKGHYLPGSMVSANGSLFTHIVKITYASGSWQAGQCDFQVDLKRGLLLLNLIVPAPVSSIDRAPGKDEDETRTILTEQQLLVARDFLALALPYYVEAHPRLRASAYNVVAYDSVRVMITAPEGKGAAGDIMSVAACYLAWASDQPAGTVVEYIKTEKEMPAIWRDAVNGKEAIEFIGRVARLK